MRIVVGLGGTALAAGERAGAPITRRHVRAAAGYLAPLAREHQLLLCHGSGPQISPKAPQVDHDDPLARPDSLDVITAQTQGLVGYWLVQELRRAGVAEPIAAIVTHAVVDPRDPGFCAPSAFVGPGYTPDQVQLGAGELGWPVARDGRGWRRVVPSVAPVRVLEMPSIAALVDASVLVVCGGSGIPVCAGRAETGGGFDGVDAVVDGDHTAALLAVELDADRLLLLTDVAEVSRDFGQAHATPLRWASVAELSVLPLAARTMAPKVEAACRFVRATDRPAIIGAFADASRVVDGLSGTVVTAY